jgi:ketosteroid isomerase-like protein
MSDARVEIAKQLFAGWSSGDPDAPEALMTPDAVLHDVASGTFEGWPAIRAFFATGLARWDDLALVPDEFWANERGIALHYEMSATVRDPTIYGPEYVGRTWSVGVMSFLRFDGDRVCYEADFHDRGSRARSLGIR